MIGTEVEAASVFDEEAAVLNEEEGFEQTAETRKERFGAKGRRFGAGCMSRVKRPRRGQVCLVLAGITLIIVVSMTVGTIFSLSAVVAEQRVTIDELTAPEVSHRDFFLRHDAEFQLALNLSQWNTTEDVETMVNRYIDEVNQFGLLELKREDALESIREQFHYSTKKPCGVKYDIRGRRYLDGYKNGTQYYDIKFKDEDKEIACSQNLKPADYIPFHIDNGETTAKCEQDIHVCKTKHSLENRIFVNSTLAELPYIYTCKDVMLLWPWSMPDIVKVKKDGTEIDRTYNQLKQNRKLHYWKVIYFKTSVGEGEEVTDFQINYTLKYDTLEDLLAGNQIVDGSEWSVKIFTLDGGASEVYNEDILDRTQQMYDYLVDVFGSGDDLDEFGNCDGYVDYDEEDYDEEEDD